MIFTANGSYLYYKEFPSGMVSSYYEYIITLIKHIFELNINLNVNIILCDDYNFNNNNKTLNININIEHTLVKPGGRGVAADTPYGIVFDEKKEKYLVRIDKYDKLNNSDIIIDYSNPNIYNVNTCSIYNSFSKKHIYISPSIYEQYFYKDNRNIITLTTFINTNELRRSELLKKINNENIQHANINNCFDKIELQNVLKRTKILINVHQTPHHHTFEELRVLPALECGVIVISENSPLIELIPYSNLIIWVKYDDIIEKIKEVINNYDIFHNQVFSEVNKTILCNIRKVNYSVLHNEIIKNI